MSLNRYEYTSNIDNDRYGTTRYPDFPLQESDKYIISREGDRLDLLANQFYGDPRYWWILATVNNLGKGTLIVPPSIQLRIPFPINDVSKKLRETELTK